jgi:hypothetical protein
MHPPPVAASRLAPGGWLEGWEITPYYQPAREVGGDFYDFFELEEGRVGIVVGDATGKGVPAALVESATSSMLRAVAQALGPAGVSGGLDTLDRRLARVRNGLCTSACLYPGSPPLIAIILLPVGSNGSRAGLNTPALFVPLGSPRFREHFFF